MTSQHQLKFSSGALKHTHTCVCVLGGAQLVGSTC